MNEAKGAAQHRYEQLQTAREPFLRRARECSELTIPSLIPPDSHTGYSDFETPWQSIGAEGVNNLSAKLLLTLLPPNSPFFRLDPDPGIKSELKQNQQTDAAREIQEGLSREEQSIKQYIEASADRVTMGEAVKHLVVGGNTLLYKEDYSSTIRMYPLDSYVIRRSPSGTVLEIVVEEGVAPEELDEDTKEACGLNDVEEVTEEKQKTLRLYTHIKFNQDRSSEVYQEINGVEVPESRGTYKKGMCPWMALRWSKVDKEAYGRGYVEEYLGDLKSLNSLWQSIVEGAAGAAKLLFMVNPNGVTKARTIAEARNCSIIQGNREDVDTLHADKHNDFKTVETAIARLEQRLSRAFLMTTSIQRDAERVTAEEIRLLAANLEEQLGGIYSLLSVEFQHPYIILLIKQLQRARKIAPWPNDMVTPSIVTGLEALGRGHDLQKLQTFTQAMAPLGPETLAQYMNMGEFISRTGVSLGIDMKGLIKTPEEIQMAEQAAQQQQMMAMLGPEAVKQAGGVFQKNVESQGGNPNG